MVRKSNDESSRFLFEQKFGKPIEEFDTFKIATEALAEETKIDYYKRLSKFFLWLDETPDQVITNRKTQLKADDETSDYYERKVRAYKKIIEETQTGRSVRVHIGRIQGFFTNNSSRFSLDLGSLKYDKARKVAKYSPDNAVCREIYGFCDSARDRLIFALAHQNGLVPVDIAGIKCSKLPTEPFKYYEGSRSKTGEIWHGVTTPEIIQEFLSYKKIRGEPVNGEPLFKSREGFLDASGISQLLSTIIKKSGYGDIPGFKPTSLRDGFEDALVDAELPNKVKEAMMGHAGAIEHQYGGQKQLEARLEEAMQKAYKFLMLTDVVTGNGKSAQKISDLDNALIESQKKISAQDTIIESLTDRLAKTEKALIFLKRYSTSACKKELMSVESDLAVLQRKLLEGTTEDPEETTKEVESLKMEIADMKDFIKVMNTPD
jgi:hypothetical protein